MKIFFQDIRKGERPHTDDMVPNIDLSVRKGSERPHFGVQDKKRVRVVRYVGSRSVNREMKQDWMRGHNFAVSKVVMRHTLL